jgi:hypothetical protein
MPLVADMRLLGPPSLEGPHGLVHGRAAQDRKLAVLAVLARAENRTVTRDFLAAMFWPDSDQHRVRHNEGDLARAADLYTGRFTEGFHISHTPQSSTGWTTSCPGCWPRIRPVSRRPA